MPVLERIGPRGGNGAAERRRSLHSRRKGAPEQGSDGGGLPALRVAVQQPPISGPRSSGLATPPDNQHQLPSLLSGGFTAGGAVLQRAALGDVRSEVSSGSSGDAFPHVKGTSPPSSRRASFRPVSPSPHGDEALASAERLARRRSHNMSSSPPRSNSMRRRNSGCSDTSSAGDQFSPQQWHSPVRKDNASDKRLRKRMSVKEREVLGKVENMDERECEELEQRYQDILSRERQRQALLRNMQQGELMGAQQRSERIRRQSLHNTNRQQEARKARQEAEADEERARQEEAAQREGDRDLAVRRQRRLAVALITGLACDHFLRSLHEGVRQRAKAAVYRNLQPRMWRALAATRLKAAGALDVFMVGALRRWRFRRKYRATTVIARTLQQQRIRIYLRCFFTLSRKLQRWWRSWSRCRKAQVAVNLAQWDLAEPIWREARQQADPSGQLHHIPVALREQRIRCWLHHQQKEFFERAKAVGELRARLQYDLEQGKLSEDALDPSSRMLLRGSHAPRLRRLARIEEMVQMVRESYAALLAHRAACHKLWHHQQGARDMIDARRAADMVQWAEAERVAKQKAATEPSLSHQDSKHKSKGAGDRRKSVQRHAGEDGQRSPSRRGSVAPGGAGGGPGRRQSVSARRRGN